MSSKPNLSDVVGVGVIGAALVVALVVWGIDGRLTPQSVSGFLVGTIAGYVATIVMLVPTPMLTDFVRRFLALTIAGLGAPLLFFVSVHFAGGYFAGAGSVFCFCWSVASIVRIRK